MLLIKVEVVGDGRCRKGAKGLSLFGEKCTAGRKVGAFRAPRSRGTSGVNLRAGVA